MRKLAENVGRERETTWKRRGEMPQIFWRSLLSHCLAVLVKSGGGMINEFSDTEESGGYGERATLKASSP